MSVNEGIALQELRCSPQHSREEQVAQADLEGVVQETVEQPSELRSDEQEDWRPTRRYQMILLAAGFTMIFHVIGLNSIYGIFQEFYTSPRSNIKNAQGQDALVSLVGTIGTCLTWSGSIYVNPLIARVKHVQWIMLAGVFIMSLGIFLASFSTELWHLYLTQGLLYGIGASLYYFPILALTPVYFDQHRGFALGFILSGASIGGLILSFSISALISHVGIGWALRILGVWNLVAGVPVSLVVKKRGNFYGPGSGSSRVSLSVARRGAFIWQAFGAFLQAGGNVVPTYFLTTYSVSVLSYSSNSASTLLAISNAVSSVARIAMGILADRFGRQNMLIASVLLSAISVLALWPSAPRPRFIAFVISYVILAGGYNGLLPATIAEVYGVQHYTSVNSIIYFIRGLGALFGAPLAGVILGSHQRGFGVYSSSTTSMTDLHILRTKYNQVAFYDGAVLFVAGLCIVYVRWSDARYRGRWQWKA
ncbi:uncharacterized protein PHACADRAFT_124322 [Phanerochaete carnosa HHB-10118-sp]|uniref:Major facilitator superfamily (MFS) profile domain-containing protein n=1 Tax=Phanerochaete carnosa (strain HHB-10118-sp) TaxID=650164 RepID=K5WWS5_PHACS|nr:uncharacterized protein PHACADRAFT_124322 [Phanerochaete carnosa HHB-10118-sp]EKM54907.1 hypothetical protein PHACADRAFT_124322 [Phanerochaete carnosa HHB-10118-sp]